jgi:hypothetical protein
MPDVTVKSIDDMEAIYGGLARRARAELGVTAWGMQVFTLPPDWDGYPNHNHSSDAFDPNQEEVYIPLSGAAMLVADGSEFELLPGTMVRVAIQLLSPKQRAVLILRDVLGWSAKEAADVLGDSVAAVTSALQRARAAVEKRRRHVPAPDAQERALLRQFMTAWDAVDIDGLVSLLSEDALMTMPPERMRVAGARAIGDFFGSVPQEGRLDEIRLVHTSANRQPALAAYSRGDGGKHRPYGLMVLEIDGGLISGIVGFLDPWLFERCGLPHELT